MKSDKKIRKILYLYFCSDFYLFFVQFSTCPFILSVESENTGQIVLTCFVLTLRAVYGTRGFCFQILKFPFFGQILFFFFWGGGGGGSSLVPVPLFFKCRIGKCGPNSPNLHCIYPTRGVRVGVDLFLNLEMSRRALSLLLFRFLFCSV